MLEVRGGAGCIDVDRGNITGVNGVGPAQDDREEREEKREEG